MTNFKIFAAVAALSILGACAESGNNAPAPTRGWSGGESPERSQERSGELNPGETFSPEGVDDNDNGVGFGAISG